MYGRVAAELVESHPESSLRVSEARVVGIMILGRRSHVCLPERDGRSLFVDGRVVIGLRRCCQYAAWWWRMFDASMGNEDGDNARPLRLASDLTLVADPSLAARSSPEETFLWRFSPTVPKDRFPVKAFLSVDRDNSLLIYTALKMLLPERS